MAPERAEETSENESPVDASATEPPCRAELGDLRRDLDAIRSTLQTAVLADVVALLAEPEAAAPSDLERRARAIQVELTLRRQDIALAEWRRKLAASEQEAARRAALFVRLEADFERRTAEFDRRTAEFAERSAEYDRQEAEFERRSAAFAQQAEEFQRILDEFTRRSAEFDRRSGEYERRIADLHGEVTRLHHVEDSLWATLAERDAAHAAAQSAAAAAAKAALDRQAGELAAAKQLGETQCRRAETLEQDRARAEQQHAADRNALAAAEANLSEAERRIAELQCSRWRRLGLRLGLAKRATFE
jgi:hypothetical protein